MKGGNVCIDDKKWLLLVVLMNIKREIQNSNMKNYCHDGGKIFLITTKANIEVTKYYYITDSNDESFYVAFKKINTINSINVRTKLIQLTEESMNRLFSQLYIISKKIIDNNIEKGQIEKKIYICNE
ncbi:hypothetical protein U3516DRAFT_666479 [Neocallimastix sp. 'constans']